MMGKGELSLGRCKLRLEMECNRETPVENANVFNINVCVSRYTNRTIGLRGYPM